MSQRSEQFFLNLFELFRCFVIIYKETNYNAKKLCKVKPKTSMQETLSKLVTFYDTLNSLDQQKIKVSYGLYKNIRNQYTEYMK